MKNTFHLHDSVFLITFVVNGVDDSVEFYHSEIHCLITIYTKREGI